MHGKIEFMDIPSAANQPRMHVNVYYRNLPANSKILWSGSPVISRTAFSISSALKLSVFFLWLILANSFKFLTSPSFTIRITGRKDTPFNVCLFFNVTGCTMASEKKLLIYFSFKHIQIEIRALCFILHRKHNLIRPLFKIKKNF